MNKLKIFAIFPVLVMLMACGELDGDWEHSSSSNKLSSSSHNNSSSSVNSSNSCVPINMDLHWQDAPANSYVHGSTSITMDAYQISTYLITQGQYKTIMGDNPSKGIENDALPVDGVSWFKAEEFCKKLSEQKCLKPDAIKLPTEAQWEYVVVYATIIQRYDYYYEWTNDCFDKLFPWTIHDPSGPSNCFRNDPKVVKGSNGLNYDWRSPIDPNSENMGGTGSYYIGFRVAVKNKDL
jgi:hypothetical protein